MKQGCNILAARVVLYSTVSSLHSGVTRAKTLLRQVRMKLMRKTGIRGLLHEQKQRKEDEEYFSSGIP